MVSMKSARWAGLIDQGLYSLVTFSQTVVYARTMSPTEFGLFAMVAGGVLLAMGVHRSVVVLPMIVAHSAGDAVGVRAWRRLNGLLIALVVAALLLASAGGHVLGADGALLVRLCLLVAVAVPAYFLYELVRRTLFLGQRPEAVVRTVLLYGTLQVVGIALVVALEGSAASAVGVWVVAKLISAGMGHVWARGVEAAERQHGAMALMHRYRHDMGWSLAATLPYMTFNSAIPVMLGFMVGPGAAGAFAATRLLLAPVTTLISAVDSADKPRAARALRDGGAGGLATSLRRTARTLLKLGGPYLLVAAFAYEPLLRMLLGAAYPNESGYLWLWLVTGLAMMLGQPLETGLLMLRRTHWYFWSRLLAAAVGVAVLGLLAPSLGYQSGILATCMAWFASSVFAILMLRTALRRS